MTITITENNNSNNTFYYGDGSHLVNIPGPSATAYTTTFSATNGYFIVNNSQSYYITFGSLTLLFINAYFTTVTPTINNIAFTISLPLPWSGLTTTQSMGSCTFGDGENYNAPANIAVYYSSSSVAQVDCQFGTSPADNCYVNIQIQYKTS